MGTTTLHITLMVLQHRYRTGSAAVTNCACQGQVADPTAGKDNLHQHHCCLHFRKLVSTTAACSFVK
jgi:hypothetical protein